MALLTLKFSATCKECGAALEAGTRARYYGRGRVYGTTCHPQSPRPRSERSAYAPRGAWRRPAPAAPRGRCEDAPCCGCCDTGANGSEPFPGYGY